MEQETDDVAVEFGEDFGAKGGAASDEFEDQVAAVTGLDKVAVGALEFPGDGIALGLGSVFYELERVIVWFCSNRLWEKHKGRAHSLNDTTCVVLGDDILDFTLDVLHQIIDVLLALLF